MCLRKHAPIVLLLLHCTVSVCVVDTRVLQVSEANAAIQAQAKSIKTQLTALHDAPASSRGPEANQPLLPRPDSAQALKVKKLLQDFTNILQDYKATQKVRGRPRMRHASCIELSHRKHQRNMRSAP